MRRLRSFIHKETRKLGHMSIVATIFLSLCVFSFLKARYCPGTLANLHAPTNTHVQMIITETESSTSQSVEKRRTEDSQKPMCTEWGTRSITCEMVGEVMIEGNSSTVYVPSYDSTAKLEEWKIKPYNRKSDPIAMSRVSEVLIKPYLHHEQMPHCTQNHSVPAIIFSVGGFTGNLFHDFTDVLIPLFITAHQFHGDVQFIITDSKPWWIGKFRLILKQLSKYEIIELNDNEEVHCLQGRLIVGTNFHKEFGVDPSKSPNGYSMSDFKELLRRSFSLERGTAIQIGDEFKKRPKLLIISRAHSRKFVNERGIVEMAKSLGYDVVVAEANSSTNISKFARLVNSCDVLMGVHGAGLTNMVFLPHGAVIIQVVPFGRLEWLAGASFKEPAMDMKLNYLEYRIQEEESTLAQQYPQDHPVIRDPFSIHKQGWMALRTVYLDNQDVKPNLGKLRNTLIEALKYLREPN
ncbi:hypothetical protein AAC387_Pa09g0619 [Persea americana]